MTSGSVDVNGAPGAPGASRDAEAVAGARETRVRRRIVLAAGISQTGNWLTFLAVVIGVQAAHGSAASAGVFFAQTVPAILGARAISDRIPPDRTYRAWVSAQIALAVLSVSMYWLHGSLAYTYVFVAVAMLLRAVSNPLLYTLISASLAPARRESAYTAVGAAGSITLVLAPAAGGALTEAIGISWLFALDALSFVAGVLVLLPGVFAAIPARTGDSTTATGTGTGAPSPRPLLSWARRPARAGPLVTRGILVWFAFMLVGAALNSVELPAFKIWLHFSNTALGITLACYGLGGLTSLVIAMRYKSWSASPVACAIAYLAGLCAWMYGAGPLNYAGFFVMGLASALVSGSLRGAMAKRAEREGVAMPLLWGWVNQSVLVANLVMYTLATAAFLVRVPLWSLLAVLLAMTAGWVFTCVSLVRSDAVPPARSPASEPV